MFALITTPAKPVAETGLVDWLYVIRSTHPVVYVVHILAKHVFRCFPPILGSLACSAHASSARPTNSSTCLPQSSQEGITVGASRHLPLHFPDIMASMHARYIGHEWQHCAECQFPESSRCKVANNVYLFVWMKGIEPVSMHGWHVQGW